MILVVVDHFSKGAHFGMLPTNFAAYKVAQLFISMVCKLHGFPKILISDRDPIFMSRFWKENFKLNGTKLRMSTAYNLQSDGQTEVLNRTLEQYLRAYVHHRPSQWGNFLSLIEWCYNTTCHSTINMTPYLVTYGKPPHCIPHYISGSSIMEVVDSFLSSHEDKLSLLKCKLRKAQQLMKQSIDKHRRDLSYAIGDWVYVKLRPYRQTLSSVPYQKLGKRYYGPYQVTEVISIVAYLLALLETAKIHPVFHYSLLNGYPGPVQSPL